MLLPKSPFSCSSVFSFCCFFKLLLFYFLLGLEQQMPHIQHKKVQRWSIPQLFKALSLCTVILKFLRKHTNYIFPTLCARNAFQEKCTCCTVNPLKLSLTVYGKNRVVLLTPEVPLFSLLPWKNSCTVLNNFIMIIYIKKSFCKLSHAFMSKFYCDKNQH